MSKSYVRYSKKSNISNYRKLVSDIIRYNNTNEEDIFRDLDLNYDYSYLDDVEIQYSQKCRKLREYALQYPKITNHGVNNIHIEENCKDIYQKFKKENIDKYLRFFREVDEYVNRISFLYN